MFNLTGEMFGYFVYIGEASRGAETQACGCKRNSCDFDSHSETKILFFFLISDTKRR